MNDVQKKLDELISLREQLVHLTNNFELAGIKNISGTSNYVSKVQVIAEQYQDRQLENKTNFNNATNKVRNKIKESQRLARESQLAARESQRLANENIKNFNKLNLAGTKQCVSSIESLIGTIDVDIINTTKELTRLKTLDKIYNQCNTDEYLKHFLIEYLNSDIVETVDDALSITTFKIKSHCDWKYPGLQLHPMSEEWINCMITADPLYLTYHTDISIYNKNLSALPEIPVAESISTFTIDYQRRLRIYNIKNQDFSALPQESFGCISCCNFLNQFTLADIEHYLRRCFELLKPGGTLICTLNFNYVMASVNLVEYDYFKYAVDRVIVKFFENNRYKIISTVDLSAGEWSSAILIEAQKPGELTTSKAHQVLGSIIEK
jgi:hypothetical protein